MSKHRSISWLSRLLHVNQNPTNRLKPHSKPPTRWRHSTPRSSPIPRTQNVSSFLPAPLLSQSSLFLARGLSTASTASADDSDFEYEAPRAVRELLAEVEREKAREKEAKKKAGINVDAEEEEEEDYMGVGPLIEKLEKAGPLSEGMDLEILEEPTDSDSDEEVNDEFQAEELGDMEEQREIKKIKRHEELMKKFKESDNLDDAHRWMSRIDRFEEKHFRLRPEYRVIGEMMNRFKVAAGKEKFLLAQKLNRALRLLDWKEQYDPEDSSNYGLIKQEQVGSAVELQEEAEFEKEKPSERGGVEENELDEFDDMKERDDILLAKLNEIDQKLEEKLGELEYTFGKKGKLLEEEIRDLAEERNSLQEKKRRPLYRKGFDVRLIDVNRTCKVTKGGQIAKYTAILACGNYNGVVGYAKAKGPAIPVALQKAYEKCFQNLHYVDLYEDHTIAHAIQTTYKKTKVYLWPASTTTGMKAGRTVQTILNLAGFKNVKSKVIGSRNPHNTVKALFQALNAVESPKDVQEKFGRTVVESYLLDSK